MGRGGPGEFIQGGKQDLSIGGDRGGIVREDMQKSHVMAKHLVIIIMYIYHALINALIAHVIHINLNVSFYTHAEHSPNKTVYIKYYTGKQTRMHTQ